MLGEEASGLSGKAGLGTSLPLTQSGSRGLRKHQIDCL